jgi:hypothetical protein
VDASLPDCGGWWQQKGDQRWFSRRGVAVAVVGSGEGQIPGGRSCGDSRWGRLPQVPDAVGRSGRCSSVSVVGRRQRLLDMF